MDFKVTELYGESWIHLVLDKDKWRSLATGVTNLGVPRNLRIFFDQSRNLSFSRTLLHGFSQNLVRGVDREGERKKVFYLMKLSISNIINWSNCGVTLKGNKQYSQKKPVPVSLCPSQFPDGFCLGLNPGFCGESCKRRPSITNRNSPNYWAFNDMTNFSRRWSSWETWFFKL